MKSTICVALSCAVLLGTLNLVLAEDKPASKATPKVAETRTQPAAAAASSKTKPAKSELSVIGYLEGRGKTIIIKSGPKGPVYSVKGPDGKLLFEDLSAEQLQAQAPDVGQLIKSAVAVNSRGPSRTPVIDASLGRSGHR